MSPSTRTPLILGAVAMVMLGGAFASKPLYDTFCRVTGFGGTTRRADAATGETLARTVTVRFDANTSRGVPIDFRPLQRTETVHLGEQGLAWFRAENRTDEPVAFVSTFNVTPHKAGPYFSKIECFCFTEQLLEPGESIEMPVSYFVDAALADAPRMGDVTAITLSYTLFRSLDGLPDTAAIEGLDARGGQG